MFLTGKFVYVNHDVRKSGDKTYAKVTIDSENGVVTIQCDESIADALDTLVKYTAYVGTFVYEERSFKNEVYNVFKLVDVLPTETAPKDGKPVTK